MKRFIDHILENRCLSRMKLRMYGMKDLPQRQRYKEYCRVPQCHRVHGTTLSLNRLYNVRIRLSVIQRIFIENRMNHSTKISNFNIQKFYSEGKGLLRRENIMHA